MVSKRVDMLGGSGAPPHDGVMAPKTLGATMKHRAIPSVAGRDPPIIIVVGDEPLPHCKGAVNGGGKRFRSFVGSARTACNWSL